MKTRCPRAHAGDIAVDEGELERRLAGFPGGCLDLCKVQLGPAGLPRVFEALDALRAAASCSRLLLGTGAIGDEGACALAAHLQRDERLDTLYLGCNRIGHEGVTALATAIEARGRLSALWLKRNPIGPRGGERLAKLLQTNKTLRVLDVFNCELEDEGASAIASAALGHPTLEHLYLGANGVGPRALAALERLLVSSSRLRTLHLASNDLEPASAIARGLAANRGLEILDLSSSGLTDVSARLLADAASSHPTLVRLRLGNARSGPALGASANRVGNVGARALASLVRANSPLGQLELSANGIDSDGAAALLAALEANTHLFSLPLGHGVAKRIRARITAILARNAARWPASVLGIPEHVVAIRSDHR